MFLFFIQHLIAYFPSFPTISFSFSYDPLGLFYSDGDGGGVQSFWEGDGDAAITVDAVLQSLAGAEQSDTLRG